MLLCWLRPGQLRDTAHGFRFTNSSRSLETSWEAATHRAESKIFLTQPLQTADGVRLCPKAALTEMVLLVQQQHWRLS